MRGRHAAICLPLVCVAFIAQAQPTEDVSQLVSGPMQPALVQSAQVVWQKMSQSERSCFDRTLHQHGLSLTLIISHGVMPNNPHLGKLKKNCAKFRSDANQQREANRAELHRQYFAETNNHETNWRPARLDDHRSALAK